MKNEIKWFIVWGIMMIIVGPSFPDGSWMTQSGLLVLLSGLILLTLKKRSNKQSKNKIILIITEVTLLILATTYLVFWFFSGTWFNHPFGLLLSIGVWGYVIIVEILKIKKANNTTKILTNRE